MYNNPTFPDLHALFHRHASLVAHHRAQAATLIIQMQNNTFLSDMEIAIRRNMANVHTRIADKIAVDLESAIGLSKLKRQQQAFEFLSERNYAR